MAGHTYTTIAESAGHRLMRREDGKFVVVGVHRTDGGRGFRKVTSVMPGDMPKGGGTWQGNDNDAGIAYVTTGYSESYARRMYRQFVSDAQASMAGWRTEGAN